MPNMDEIGKNIMDFGERIVQKVGETYDEEIKPAVDSGLEKAKPFIADAFSKAAEALANASEKMAKVAADAHLEEKTIEPETPVEDEKPAAPEDEDPMKRFADIRATRETSDMITDFFKNKH